MLRIVLLLVSTGIGLVNCGFAQAQAVGLVDRLAEELRADFRAHYSLRPLGNVAFGFAVTGVLANTNADQEVQDVFRDDLKGGLGDDLTELFTDVGDIGQPLPAVPIYLGVMWLGNYGEPNEAGAARWGGDALRAMLIGTPQLVALSHLSGGQRPEEGEPGWDPFEDDNGVSGHAFFGAVPIMAAARRTENRWLRLTLNAVSALPGLARVYDEKHYMSQVFMGWWLARAATRTVARRNVDGDDRLTVSALPYADGGGVQVWGRF